MRLENLSDADLRDLVLEVISQVEAVEWDGRLLQGKLEILRAEQVTGCARGEESRGGRRGWGAGAAAADPATG